LLVFASRTTAAVLLFAVAWLPAAPAAGETVRVGAAISLKDALADVVSAYEADTGDKVELSLGSSGQLLAQIKNGADVDVFVSAAAKQVDELERAGLAAAATRRTVVSNTLVLVVPAGKDAPASFEALGNPAGGRVAAGEPKTVPAGQYAAQVFAALKLTDALAGRLVYGTNVRQVLAYVERGEVAAGVVYGTDAREAGGKVRVVATAAPGTHEPIVYLGVVLTATKRPAAAKRFLDYLGSAKARAALRARGFVVPADEAAATRPGGR
jgi:molybdate transport system substrate-binding protein